jgi:Holliday junction resolvase RusA-like endonuclease
MPVSKKGRIDAEAGRIRPITKPDTDNYVKLILDSMNGLFWRDDAQVVEITASKHYSGNPRIEVKLREV